MTSASARGLFRATGKQSKPVPRQMLDGSYERVDALEREKDDFYPTPPEPTRAFLHAEIDRLRDFGTIWEPAAGDGAMVREMELLGLTVRASDLVDRGCEADIRSFYDFPVPAGGLAPFWAEHPCARVYLMRWKIDFTGQGAPPMLNAWFVWDKAHKGETVLRMLDRKDARQGELFGEAA